MLPPTPVQKNEASWHNTYQDWCLVPPKANVCQCVMVNLLLPAVNLATSITHSSASYPQHQESPRLCHAAHACLQPRMFMVDYQEEDRPQRGSFLSLILEISSWIHSLACRSPWQEPTLSLP